MLLQINLKDRIQYVPINTLIFQTGVAFTSGFYFRRDIVINLYQLHS